jgi:hypothetical protein
MSKKITFFPYPISIALKESVSLVFIALQCLKKIMPLQYKLNRRINLGESFVLIGRFKTKNCGAKVWQILAEISTESF